MATFSVTTYGAVADGRYDFKGEMDEESATLKSDSAAFTAADVGKTVVVLGAGAHDTNLKARIIAVAANEVTLDEKAKKKVEEALFVYGTDNTGAFNACQEAMTASLFPEEQRAGVFYVPPAEEPYFLAGDFHLRCQARYQGDGTGGGHSGSRILFAPGAGFRIRGDGNIPLMIGDATEAVLSGFEIECLPDYYLRLPTGDDEARRVYKGQRFRVQCRNGVHEPSAGNGEFLVHYEVVTEGVVDDPEADFWTGPQPGEISGCNNPDNSVTWDEIAGKPLSKGTLLRHKFLPDHADVFFLCIVAAGNAPTIEPNWTMFVPDLKNLPPLPDASGNMWTPVPSLGTLVRNGTAVFACRTAAAVFASTQCTIERNWITGCLGAAIHVAAGQGVFPSGGASCATLRDNTVAIPKGMDAAGNPSTGVGIAIYGGDASNVLVIRNRVVGTEAHALRPAWEPNHPYEVGDRVRAPITFVPDQDARQIDSVFDFECIDGGGGKKSGGVEPSWQFTTIGEKTPDGTLTWKAIPCPPEYGIFDRSFFGGRYIACLVEVTAGPGFALLNPAGGGGTYGCYSENSAADVYDGSNAMYGGNPCVPRFQGTGMSIHSGQIVNCLAESRPANGPPSRIAYTKLAPITGGFGPQSLTWQTGWRGPHGAVLEAYGQALVLLGEEVQTGDGGWWTCISGASPRIGSWGWSTNQAALAGRLAGPNIFQLTRCFAFGNHFSDPPFLWFAGPLSSRDTSVLNGYRRRGDRRCRAASEAAPGTYLDEVVTIAGYEAEPMERERDTEYGIGSPIGTSNPAPPDVRIHNGIAYQCTKAGSPDVMAEPTWPSEEAQIVALTWDQLIDLRVGQYVRTGAGGVVKLRKVTKITVQRQNDVERQIEFASTGIVPPMWQDALETVETHDQPNPELKITTCITYGAPENDQPNSWVEDGTCVWTRVGVEARWTPANRVHALANGGAGQVVLDLSGGDYLLTEEDAATSIIKAHNTGADRTITLPVPADDPGAYQRIVRNRTGGTLTVKTPVDAGVSLGPGTTAIVGFDPAGTFLVTTAV